MTAIKPIETAEGLKSAPEEFQNAIKKIVISHAINELHGSRVFDEPALAYAPTPYAKWMACRVVMEEYGHHYRFFELGREIGIPESRMLPEQTEKKPLNIFSFQLESWEQFCAIKAIGDLAEILQVEDLIHCPFVPLRQLARMTMPEERFHCDFGVEFCLDIMAKKGGREIVQKHLNTVFPEMLKFFGATGSKNNEIYRKWGIKKRTNEEMRADYIARAKDLVENRLGLALPAVH